MAKKKPVKRVRRVESEPPNLSLPATNPVAKSAAQPDANSESSALLDRRKQDPQGPPAFGERRRNDSPRDPHTFTLLALQEAVNRLFESFNVGFGSPGLEYWEQTLRSSTPRVQVEDKGSYYEISAQLLGLEEKNLHVSVAANMVTILGEKRIDRDSSEGELSRMERTFGAFHRQITLPSPVVSDKAQASFRDGKLFLILPKRLQPKPTGSHKA